METDTTTLNTPEQKNFIDMRFNTIVQVILLGIIVGAASWLLTLLLDRFIMSAILCNGETVNGVCASSTSMAGNVAIILTGIGGLFGLVRLGIYRPLLIIIASAIVLWGLSGYVSGLQWYESMAWVVALTALVYTAFAWLVRPRMFLIAIILVMIVVVASRIIPAIY